MNLDTATDAMNADPNRNEVVVGKTKTSLRGRFECLVAPGDASPYLQTWLACSPWRGEAAFIRKSRWLVIFNREKAVDPILLKGC